mgnify:CR=1 FL=1
MLVGERQSDLIGQTDLLRIPSLSDLTGCDIFLKCEFQNPGGSIKDRAAKQLIEITLSTTHRSKRVSDWCIVALFGFIVTFRVQFTSY